MAPLIITGDGISKTMMGIILGSSSIVGMFFDIVLCKLFKKSNVRKMYLVLFLICAIYPLILWKSKTVWMYIFAMGVWGLYYDIFNIGQYDFVGRYIKKEEHASSFGVLQVFLSIGYLIAPLFAGLLISEVVDATPFIGAWIFLGIAFLFFIIFLLMVRKTKEEKNKEVIKKSTSRKRFYELQIWKGVAKKIFPILIITLMLSIIDSTFWTIGPLVVDGWANVGIIGGLFMTAYLLPFLLVGWIIGGITQKFGNFKTSNISLLLGSLIFSLLFFMSNPILIIISTFIGTIFFAISLPANSGSYADCISGTNSVKAEIETQADFVTNLGCVIGPMMAGFLADYLGNIASFSIIGIMGVIVTIILFLIHKFDHAKAIRMLESS
jgi:MFS family permease